MHHLLNRILLAACAAAFAGTALPATHPAPGSTARILPIAGDAFAGTSVNVLAGLQNNLYTHGNIQYAAFYAADSTLVLARRPLGSDSWETRRTQYKAGVSDAHRTVSLVADGAGFLHVAWDHHANALNYCRSTAPGSLELGPRQPMTGEREDKVTYPAFLRLAGGDLLFLYRDGVSGKGNLVLNRYATRTGTWRQVQANLIDGEARRSAYASLHADRKGHLHLAWVWRDTGDVATNHDLAYARSTDGGATWLSVAGKPLTVPITADGADYALRIPTGSSLMNPPTVTADNSGNPLIANYWTPAGSDIPQYHLVRYTKDGWNVQQITRRSTPFVLKGTSTKRPPVSRSVLVSVKNWNRPNEAHLIFRDDERGGRAVLHSCRNLDVASPEWVAIDLTVESLGAWEPSLDPEQWVRLGQVQMLVQTVEQRDGDDTTPAATQPSTLSSLIWSPFLAGLSAERTARPPTPLPVPAAGELERPLDPAALLALLERVTDWQLAQPYKRDPRGWEIAPFYIGGIEVGKLSASPRFIEAFHRLFEKMEWKTAPRDYHADDYCVVQAYAELSRKHNDPRMLAPSRATFDRILAKPAPITDWGRSGATDRWTWCDALFMGPASWLDVYNATGDRRYLDFMNQEWWATTTLLHVAADRFYARDESFLDLREPNTRRLYWSRGNGWVVAGLARTIDRFPKDHADFPRYVRLYRDMMDVVLDAQQHDGLWRPGLLDPAAHPAQEASGSSFYTFALAWGINRGLLDRARAEPAVRRAWNALSAFVTPAGKLERVQPIGAAPEGFDPAHTDAFGVGAFLLAGSEVHRMVAPPAAAAK